MKWILWLISKYKKKVDVSSSDVIKYAEKLIPEFNIEQKTKEEKLLMQK